MRLLAAEHRLRSSAEFTEVVRRGRRAGRPTLTVHVLMPDLTSERSAADQSPPRAGLVVSKAVGGSVVRHRVARRLRHQLAPRLAPLPSGTRLVVRAAPAAAAACSDQLGADLDDALTRALR